MADHTSAEIFGRILNLLAANPNGENRQLARKIMQLSRDYDFSPYQMYADEACLALDVARLGIHPKQPQDGIIWLYYGDPGFEEASQHQAPQISQDS